jgi:hypothetical protein
MRRRVHDFIVANNFMYLSIIVAISLVIFIFYESINSSPSVSLFIRFSLLAFTFYGGIIAFTEAALAPEEIWGDLKFLRLYIAIGSFVSIIYSAGGALKLIARSITPP